MSSLLHNYLIESTKQYPDKVCVSFKDSTISFHDLNDLSNRLSNAFAKRGVTAGDRVGIYIDKSIEALIAIFGILKAGASYVPLDPLAPVERQSLIINDCRLKYLATSSKKLPQVNQILKNTGTLREVFVLDISHEEYNMHIPDVTLIFKNEIYQSQDKMPNQIGKQVTEKNLAYILYTSGSTGQPKGVMVSHKAAIAFTEWALKSFNITCDDVVSSHAPFHFDLSIFDIFASLKAGATISLVPQGLSSFPKSIVEFIENEGISIWYSVPSILTQLVLHGDLENRNFTSLRQILFAGEVFHSKYLRRLMEMMPHVKFYNLYGPTETNVITYYPVNELPDPDKAIPVGALCDGVKSYIVSETGSLVKEGEVGELYVTCPTVMDGYWNDPEKTKSVLFQNPFTLSTNEFIYKTGDLVCSNKNGNLDYHGRCDAMIKSRGYRIELGEIESALSSHTGIKEVAVTGFPDDQIGNIIKAVIVPKQKAAISIQEIKHFCSKKLPHYMIPEMICFIDALPRTSTGKIDRKSLIHLSSDILKT